eukprot:204109_1
MSNWDKADHDSMWIPSRPNASGGDRYNKRKRKENSTPHQRHRHYNHSSYNNNHNNHNTNHYNNNYRPNAYNDTKRVIIAKKKNHSSNRDINDSFVNSSKLDAKRQREHQQYLMQQHANSKEAKMADYKHKQQRYSQIKNEFGLNTTNNTNKTSGNHAQTRTIQNTQNTYNKPNGSNREKPKFKVLQRDNGRGTKLAILDLAGDMNDQQLYAELDKKSKSSMPLKPIRPPIPTPHSSQSLRLSTPTSSIHSQSKSQSESVSTRPIATATVTAHTSKTQTETVSTVPTVTLPTVQPKVVPLDSEEVEQSQRDKMRKQKESAPKQFQGGFVPHSGGNSHQYEYDHAKQEEEESVNKIINDVRQLKVDDTDNSYGYKNSKRRDHKPNNRRKYRYNSRDRYNDHESGYNASNSKRGYQSARKKQSNNDRYYAQSGSNEYYDDNGGGYDDYYARSKNESYRGDRNRNEDYYGRDRNRKRSSQRSRGNNE